MNSSFIASSKHTLSVYIHGLRKSHNPLLQHKVS